MCVCACACVCVHVRVREREREREIVSLIFNFPTFKCSNGLKLCCYMSYIGFLVFMYILLKFIFLILFDKFISMC